MTTKVRLHKLVDELSEREADEALLLVAARREQDLAGWLDAHLKRTRGSQSTRRPPSSPPAT